MFYFIIGDDLFFISPYRLIAAFGTTPAPLVSLARVLHSTADPVDVDQSVAEAKLFTVEDLKSRMYTGLYSNRCFKHHLDYSCYFYLYSHQYQHCTE